MHRGSLRKHCKSSTFFIGSIGHLDMVRFMPTHHLIAGDSFENHMHDWPLGRGELPSFFSFGLWKFHHFCQAGIEAELVLHDKNTAPDDPAGHADSFAGAPHQDGNTSAADVRS